MQSPPVPVPARAGETELQMGNLSFFGGNKQATVDGVEADLITKEEVRGMFQLWNNALATGNSDLVASSYGKETVLLPTVSDTRSTDYDSINEYFDPFLLKKPRALFWKVTSTWDPTGPKMLVFTNSPWVLMGQ